MSTHPPLPPWLAQALSDGRPSARPRPEPGPPAPGDIRLAEAMDRPGPPARLVWVRAVDRTDGTATVNLLVPDLGLAGPDDVLLPRAVTGLPYDLLRQNDVQAPVWLVQLGPRLGRSDDCDLPPAGPPLRDELDARWTHKEQELDALGDLADDCIRNLACGPAVSVIDPLSVDPDVAPRQVRMHVALHVAEAPAGSGPLVPAWLLLGDRDGQGVDRWRRAVEPDVWRLLHRAAFAGGAAYPSPPPQPEDVRIDGRVPRGDDPLAAVLADLVRRGERCVRVMTAKSLWNRPLGPERRAGDAITAFVGQARCQVLWDAVDAAEAHSG